MFVFWWLLLHLFPGFERVSGYDVCDVWFHVTLVGFWFYVLRRFGGLCGLWDVGFRVW